VVVDKKAIEMDLHDRCTVDGDVTISDDGLINVYGWVKVKTATRDGKLGFRFGKLRGYFNVSGLDLVSLEGCPKFVGGSFNCRDNKLRDLKGGPQEVGGIYRATSNPLESLEGLSVYIDKYIQLNYSDKLPLLRGLGAAEGVFLEPTNAFTSRIEDILNDSRWEGKGKAGAIPCAAALIKAGFGGNAKW
jgi:hypothetical protein